VLSALRGSSRTGRRAARCRAVGASRDNSAEAAAAGIHHVWLQQGAESPEVLKACRDAGIDAVSGECVLMFARPTGTTRPTVGISGLFHNAAGVTPTRGKLGRRRAYRREYGPTRARTSTTS
jgi:hypothetical protein